MRAIRPGDYFLLPYKGRRIDLLVKVIKTGHMQQIVKHMGGTLTAGLVIHCNLEGCQRVGAKLARKILGAAFSSPRRGRFPARAEQR